MTHIATHAVHTHNPQAAPIPRHAPAERFELLRGRVLTGLLLSDVRALQDSIARFGLLAPIVATLRGGRLVVVDGRKRLAAIRRLAFEGTLPRSLVRIPYLLVSDLGATDRGTPRLVSNRELYDTVDRARSQGESVAEIAQTLCVSRQCVRDVLCLRRLAPDLRAAFFGRLIDFAQARAFAALPDRREQMRRFGDLGPFARVADILGRKPGQPLGISAAA